MKTIKDLPEHSRQLAAADRALGGSVPSGVLASSILSFWHVQIHGMNGQHQQRVLPIGVTA